MTNRVIVCADEKSSQGIEGERGEKESKGMSEGSAKYNITREKEKNGNESGSCADIHCLEKERRKKDENRTLCYTKRKQMQFLFC